MIPVILLVTSVVFVLARVALGDPVILLLGRDFDRDTAARLREQLGLDRSIAVQYLDWLSHIARGDLGRSFRFPMPVSELMLQRLPVTLELSFLSMLLALVVALPLGTLSALKRNSGWDVLGSFVAALGISMPSFWLGILLIYLFALKLGWLPTSGYVAFTEDPITNIRYMVLPSISLSVWYMAVVLRYTRSTMLQVMREQYITTARAKGLHPRVILGTHALRNCLIPIITVIGLNVAALLGGSIITESIFALPGLGRLLVDSILGRDLPVVQGVVLFMCATVLLTNLVVDLLYGVIDPRVSHG